MCIAHVDNKFYEYTTQDDTRCEKLFKSEYSGQLQSKTCLKFPKLSRTLVSLGKVKVEVFSHLLSGENELTNHCDYVKRRGAVNGLVGNLQFIAFK